MTPYTLLVVSDSTGETGEAMARAWISQFNGLSIDLYRFSHVTTTEKVDEILDLNLERAIVVSSIIIPGLSEYFLSECRRRDVAVIDLFETAIDIIEKKTGCKASRLSGQGRELSEEYFNKISSIEFAVKYDDGKDPRGLLKADIVLLGVSRTSKTPLSMFLANKGYNVANLPLVPEVTPPDELQRVERARLIGLTVSPERLNDIRTSRLKTLGLIGDSVYADQTRIKYELAYAEELYEDLGLSVLDVTQYTIEESAAHILELVSKKLDGQIRRYEEP